MLIGKPMNVKGFTLMEIMVVLAIIGILAAIGVPKYTKTVEISRADEAVALLQGVHAANRMWVLNNCPGGNDCYCNPNLDSPCPPTNTTSLVARGYIPDYNLPKRAYCFRLANDNLAGTYSACVMRRSGLAPYNTWGFANTSSGQLCYFGINPYQAPGSVACSTLPGPPSCNCAGI